MPQPGPQDPNARRDTLARRRADGSLIDAGGGVPTITGAPVAGQPNALKIGGNPTSGRFKFTIGGDTTGWLPFDITLGRFTAAVNALPSIAGKAHALTIPDVYPITTTLAGPLHGLFIFVDFGPDCSDAAITNDTDDEELAGALAQAGIESIPPGPFSLGQRAIDPSVEAVYEVTNLIEAEGLAIPTWRKTYQSQNFRPRFVAELHAPVTLGSGLDFTTAGDFQWDKKDASNTDRIGIYPGGTGPLIADAGGIYAITLRPTLVCADLEWAEFRISGLVGYPVSVGGYFATPNAQGPPALQCVSRYQGDGSAPAIQWDLRGSSASNQDIVLSAMTMIIEEVG